MFTAIYDKRYTYETSNICDYAFWGRLVLVYIYFYFEMISQKALLFSDINYKIQF